MFDFYTLSQADYDTAKAASKLNNDHIYFIHDTNKIYKGEADYSDNVIVILAPPYTLPDNPIAGKIYLNTQTGEGKTYKDNEWVTVIRPVDNAITLNSINPVSSTAVIDYTNEVLKTYIDEIILGGTY